MRIIVTPRLEAARAVRETELLAAMIVSEIERSHAGRGALDWRDAEAHLAGLVRRARIGAREAIFLESARPSEGAPSSAPRRRRPASSRRRGGRSARVGIAPGGR